MQQHKDYFRIKEYGRTELASLYCPGISPHSAWCKLRRWLALVPGLTAQVGIIVEAIGEP